MSRREEGTENILGISARNSILQTSLPDMTETLSPQRFIAKYLSKLVRTCVPLFVLIPREFDMPLE